MFITIILRRKCHGQSIGKIDSFFEDPFWVGVFEMVLDGKITVCECGITVAMPYIFVINRERKWYNWRNKLVDWRKIVMGIKEVMDVNFRGNIYCSKW